MSSIAVAPMSGDASAPGAPRWLRASGVCFVTFLLVETALRLVLTIGNWRAVSADVGELLVALGLGALFDAVVSAAFTAPFALALLVLPKGLQTRTAFRRFAAAVWFAALFGWLFLAVSEWVFWDEFTSRFNFVAVDYLIYTKEVFGNIRESYRLEWIVPGVLLGTAAVFALSWPRLRAALATPISTRRRAVAALALVTVPALALLGLDDAHAEASRNRIVNELARNGVYSFVAAFRKNTLSYEHFYATRPDGEALQRLRSLAGAPDAQDAVDLTRHVAAATPETRHNVVFVVVESLSWWFVESFGGDPGLTPRLDELTPKSLCFSRLYATGTRTVRGLEALTLSIPPTPGRSVVKRPDNAGLFSLGDVFRDRDYDTKFIYGGYGYFDTMNAFFAGNGFDVVDRTDLADDEVQFGNVWGVCDEDLFDRVLKESDASFTAGRPFFSLVMTTSNHRPFTYPDGRIDIPSGTEREGGVKYTDYAIGRFLDAAVERPWFDDTVFVIVADHCSSARGKVDLPIDKYRIPMWIYAPKLVEPGTVDALCSQIDVGPTVLGLLGFSYDSRFCGVDALRSPPGRAVMANYLHLGLYDGEHLVTLGPQKLVRCERVNEKGKVLGLADEPRLVDDAISYYQGAVQLLTSGRYARLRRDRGERAGRRPPSAR